MRREDKEKEFEYTIPEYYQRTETVDIEYKSFEGKTIEEIGNNFVLHLIKSFQSVFNNPLFIETVEMKVQTANSYDFYEPEIALVYKRKLSNTEIKAELKQVELKKKRIEQEKERRKKEKEKKKEEERALYLKLKEVYGKEEQ